jgi:hypothetical protein
MWFTVNHIPVSLNVLHAVALGIPGHRKRRSK